MDINTLCVCFEPNDFQAMKIPVFRIFEHLVDSFAMNIVFEQLVESRSAFRPRLLSYLACMQLLHHAHRAVILHQIANDRVEAVDRDVCFLRCNPPVVRGHIGPTNGIGGVVFEPRPYKWQLRLTCKPETTKCDGPIQVNLCVQALLDEEDSFSGVRFGYQNILCAIICNGTILIPLGHIFAFNIIKSHICQVFRPSLVNHVLLHFGFPFFQPFLGHFRVVFDGCGNPDIVLSEHVHVVLAEKGILV